ncbi:Palmitoyltransferase AKR1 [Scheffersomyces xylosifermentans]|uniref:Palmitoyltransferase AKR1 n=1 Tax=Scheffersomyces xylosifermentans TaxID=1304137 RepID=UPI00315C8C46
MSKTIEEKTDGNSDSATVSESALSETTVGDSISSNGTSVHPSESVETTTEANSESAATQKSNGTAVEETNEEISAEESKGSLKNGVATGLGLEFKNGTNGDVETPNHSNGENTEVDTQSIKSTDAVLDTNKDDLDHISGASKEEPTEQDLNPDLTKFMTSCQEGNLTIVKQLITSQKVAPNDTFSDRITGLHWACINNRLTLVKYLIEVGADPNFLGGDLKASPLHWACRNGLVYIVDFLISSTNADPTLRDAQAYNALHLAVHSSNITLVVYLLLSCCDEHSKKKLYIDEPDGCSRTCLHWAAYQGDVYTINALLKFGADIAKVDDTLFLPIHWAFMKGHKVVLKSLLEAGSDINAKNDQGKNTFDIAKDMNCYATWIKVLKEDGRDAKFNWGKRSRIIQPKLGKILTFLSPYVLLPIVFAICSWSDGFAIPKLFFSLIIFAGGLYSVARFIIPTYLPEDKAVPKSPLMAGIFSATSFWAILVWLHNIIPATILSNFIGNVILAVLIGVLSWSFFKAMFINPGFVPIPADNSIILAQVKDLLKLGKFDIDHFCVNTFIRKPLRSRYSKHNKKLVARFDHYCPWVYNEIGVRNHKLFMTFVYSLNLIILTFTYLTFKYFDELEDGYESEDEGMFCSILSDELCYGYKNHHFHFNLLIWCWLQYIWIVFLCVVQTFQILKGVTTFEFSTLNNRIQNSSRFNHSTVPRDFDGFSSPPPTANGPHRHDSELKACMNLIGLDQFLITIKLSVTSLFSSANSSDSNDYTSLNNIVIPTDYGMKQNWLDFWVLGDISFRNVFYLPIEGENNLNGQVVDYYKLYEYPAKKPEALV